MKFLMDTLATISIMGGSLFSTPDIPVNEVPSVVRNAFGAEFPEAVDIEWEKMKENFKVDFEVNHTDYAVLFSKSGTLLILKQEIRNEALPVAVKETIQKKYSGYHIEEVDKVEREGKSFYQVELEGRFFDKKIALGPDGQETTKIDYWD